MRTGPPIAMARATTGECEADGRDTGVDGYGYGHAELVVAFAKMHRRY
jgi:hypothetical protein